MKNTNYDLTVFIGRFQTFHNGQLALLRRALSLAPRCLVVIGSAYQARSPKNPFTWLERTEMVRLSLSEADRERVQFIAVRDYYDQQCWVQAVKEGVSTLAGVDTKTSVALVGYRKDPTSEYLNDFSNWTLEDIGPQGLIDASTLRDAYFSAAPTSLNAALAALVEQAPGSTLEFLRAWAKLSYYPIIADEWQALRQEKAKWASSPYPPVFVTVDAVVRCDGHVLLIRRGRAPGKGLLAIPGGFIEMRETAYQSAIRELAEETNMRLLPSDMAHALKAVHIFDHPDRSQRGRVITHAHFFDLGARRRFEARAGDDAASVEWIPQEALSSLEDQFHDDHFHILDFFLGLTDNGKLK